MFLLFFLFFGEVGLDLPPVFRWFHFINTNNPILSSKCLLQVLQLYVLVSNFNTSSAIIPVISRKVITEDVHNMQTHTIITNYNLCILKTSFRFINVFWENYSHTLIQCIWKIKSTMLQETPRLKFQHAWYKPKTWIPKVWGLKISQSYCLLVHRD